MAEYRTLKGFGRSELMERRSQFIAEADRAETQEAAEAFIALRKEKYKDATHNVWAYIIDSGHLRCSDNGEPSGTAGLPVLDALKKSGLERAVIVITRYFGGVLLGAGGLIRAYASAAHLGIEAAGIVQMRSCLRYQASMDYKEWGRVQNALELSPAVLEHVAYDSGVSVHFYIEQSLAGPLIQSLTDLTGGGILLREDGMGTMEVGDL